MNFFRNRPLALCCAVILCIYFICSYLPLFRPAHKVEGEQYTEFEVTDITFRNDSIAYINGKASDGYKYHFTVYSPDELRVGDILGGVCSFKAIEKSDEFDNVRYYKSKGIWAEAEVTSPEKIGYNDNIFRRTVEGVRSFCVKQFDKYTDDDTSALLSALTVGDKSTLDDSLRRDFTRAGVSHMLAISGMHLSVIMGCISMFADVFDLNRRISAVIVIVLCLCFIFVAGISSSVLRAGLMFIIMSAGDLFRRRSDSLTNLFTAVTLILIFSPSAVFDIGLILSFTATLGIIVIVGHYMRKMNKKKETGIFRKLLSCIVISVLTTLAAQAFSFIPLIVFFNSVSIISVLSNLLLAPVLTLILFAIPLFLATSFIPFAAAGVGFVMNIATDVIIWLAALLSTIPDALVSLNYPFVPYTFVAVIIGILLTVIIRKRPAYLMPYLCWFLTFVIAFSCYDLSYGDSGDFIFYSEAGSDAVLMRNRQGSVYIDLGRGSGVAEERAFDMIEDRIYSEELRYWVITHYTKNIVYAASEYMEDFYIRNICIPVPTDDYTKAAAAELEHYAAEEGIDLIYYNYGDTLRLNGMDLTVYTPVTFEYSSVFIPSVDIEYSDNSIAYYGQGYFDYGEYDGKYDYLYLGEYGTKRKQKASPKIKAEKVIIAENNGIAAENVTGERTELTDDMNYIRFRIG